MADALAAHAAKRDSLAQSLKATREENRGQVALAKETSNLFRDREAGQRRRLDVRGFNQVLSVRENFVEAEGMIPYEALTAACLQHGVMPAVVPQLKTITLGGAVAGVGIESSSHRQGLVHDTMLELDVLLGDGRIVNCTAHNAHSDLFFGFPNSYGTLGYALRVKAKTLPVKKYVRLTHLPFTNGQSYFAELEKILQAGDADFVDGTVFSPQKMFITLGRFTDSAPFSSDYTYQNIYYRSIAEKGEDYLTTHDYIWRWDTDWFWCSKNVLAQNPLVRRIYGRSRLGSKTYTKIMRWNSRVGVTKKLERMLGLHSESVIQDVDIPIARAAEFLHFYSKEIGLWPQWICPIGVKESRFVLYPVKPGWYVNFGFWDVKRTRATFPPGYFNRLIEEKVNELGGIKSLYSDSYFPERQFNQRYGGAAYDALKKKYDPSGAFPRLYDKCVLKA
jgi:FAD/FMN-containing dehydrogenase